ncbi:hypothetical protein [Chitinophaga rhizophila]|uniref:Uncharacterized protein n=1 Tax=Chitinophaga rhizophila TaxID=2866212 RepID=A0ABS7GJL7_9BACT|nr:hypothetical protein [Chitinophaga rhizophila]MBW8687909.1 hypothetical protein [Chitinophaga rhizophila]
MKVTLFLILLLNAYVSLAQDIDTCLTVSVGLRIDRIKGRQKQIITYADSINNYMRGALPRFLHDECFDTNVNLWDNFHAPISLRWKVLEMVNNRIALKSILEKDDRKLDKKCSCQRRKEIGFNIPMMDSSFRQLIKKRYDQLSTN